MPGSAAIAAPLSIGQLGRAVSASPRVPALYLVAGAMVAGDLAGRLRPALPIWIAVGLAAAAVILFLIGNARSATALAMSAIAAAAAFAAHQVYYLPPRAATIRSLAGDQPAVLEGVVDREPEHVSGADRLYLRVRRAGLDSSPPAPATGRIRITVLDAQSFRIGERLRISARIRLPRNYGDPGEFDYESYMAREGIAATALVSHPEQIERIGYEPVALWSRVESIRRRIGAFIDAGLPYPQSAEMRALIIGDRGGIDRGLREDFALAGMAHLLVISGLHLGFVASVAFVLIRLACVPFPRLMILGYANRLGAIGAGIGAAAYAAIAGPHVSTLRALIMVLCYVGAVLANRSREVLASLAAAAVIICFALPGSSGDIGFQLSFAAVLGIVLGMRRYGAWWNRELLLIDDVRRRFRYRAAAAAGAYVAVSFFALIATAPLTAFYFNQLSLVGLIANAVVVPVMALGGMIPGLAASVMSFLWMPAAKLILHAAAAALGAGNWMTLRFVSLPGAWMRIFTPNLFELGLVYSLIALWLCAPIDNPYAAGINPVAQSAAVRMRQAAVWILLCAIGLDAAWWIHQRYFDRHLRVTFLSVGQGDAAAVQFPGGAVMLIDGGSAFKDGSGMGERVIGPFLWSRKIMRVDYLAMSHPELDHFGGFLFIARNFHPLEFWTTGADSVDSTFAELKTRLAAAGAVTRMINAQSPPRNLGGVAIACISPQRGGAGSPNNNSMVLRMSFGRWVFLFTGDLEATAERTLLARGLKLGAAVLKVPHHGSITSSTPQFVDAVHPRFAIISDGYGNRYNFPSAVVVQRYRSAGSMVLRTDRLGAIGLDAEKERITVWSGPGSRPVAALPPAP